ncbi:MAG TPA: PKD domain-containing protein [Planctomycetota bacterium]|nr:PKD domain-containing protein [Planctomycetota bacterium]
MRRHLVVVMLILTGSVRALQSDLIIEKITCTPEGAVQGTPIEFTVTVKNQGLGPALASDVAFYANRATAPNASSVPDQVLPVVALGAGARTEVKFTVATATDGNFTAWAFVDKAGLALESDETNNSGPNPAGFAWRVQPLLVAPAITSELTASATLRSDFSYKIAAEGSAPMLFDASDLPPGLTFAVDTISGVPSQSGAFDVALSASNAAGSDVKTLRLNISSGASNNPPKLASLPSAAPNPAQAGNPVSFFAAAADPDGDHVTYAWDFGDGTQESGANVSHVFSAAGFYTVRLTISDGAASDSVTLVLGVNSVVPLSGGSGGGGGGDEASLPNVFAVLKATLRINLKSANRDSLTLSGTIPVNGFVPAGKKVKLLIGSLERNVVLDARGRAGDRSNSLKLMGKMKQGVFVTTPIKFMVQLKNQALLNELQAFVFAEQQGSVIHLPVVITLDGGDWQVDFVKFSYNPETGRTQQINLRR